MTADSLRAGSVGTTMDPVPEKPHPREAELPRWARMEMRRLRDRIESLSNQRRDAGRARVASMTQEERDQMKKNAAEAIRRAKANCTHEETFEKNGSKYCRSCRRKLA